MLFKLNIVIYLILIGIQSAFAGNLKTISDNNSFENVIGWWLPESDFSKAIPIYNNSIRLNSRFKQFNDPIFFHDSEFNFLGVRELEINKENSKIITSWFDQNGKQKGNVQFDIPFDFPIPGLIISQDGSNLISVSMNNLVQIFASDGKIVNEFNITDEYFFNSENNFFFRQPAQTNLLFLAVTQAGFPLNKSHTYYSEVILCDLKGVNKFSKKFPEWQITSVNASKNAKLFTVSMHHVNRTEDKIIFKTILLDKNGKEISILPIRHRLSFFNQTLDQIIFLDTDIINLFSLNDKKIVNQIKLTQPENIFIAAEFLTNGEIISTIEGKVVSEIENKNSPWKYVDNILSVTKSTDLSRVNFSIIQDVEISNPVLDFNEETHELFVGHRNGWKIFKYQE